MHWIVVSRILNQVCPHNKIHVDNMGPTRVLSAPDWPHVGPINLAIRDVSMPSGNDGPMLDQILVAMWRHWVTNNTDIFTRKMTMVIFTWSVYDISPHLFSHYDDVIMTMLASQITSLTFVYSSWFRRTSKKTSKLRVTGLCVGNSPGTGEFPAQMASYAENVSICLRHHGAGHVYALVAALITLYIHFHGSVQDRCNFSVLAMELLQFDTKPSICPNTSTGAQQKRTPEINKFCLQNCFGFNWFCIYTLTKHYAQWANVHIVIFNIISRNNTALDLFMLIFWMCFVHY